MYGKPVAMLNKTTNQLLQTFPALYDAARYLIDNQYSHSSLTTTRQHISEVCRNKRQSAFSYKWKFI